MAERRAKLASAYVQLLSWQSDMVAAGIRHDKVTLSHLLGALERVNAVSDCIKLAQLHEQMRPGECRGVAAVRVCSWCWVKTLYDISTTQQYNTADEERRRQLTTTTT